MKSKAFLLTIFLSLLLASSLVAIFIIRQRDLSSEDSSAETSGSTQVQPLNTNYFLGAYYMPKPNYPTHQWYDLIGFNRIQAVKDFSNTRRPLLGYTDGTSIEAMNYRIKWAAEAGINYWVFNDFWAMTQNTPLYETDMKAFLASPNVNYMQFAIMISGISNTSTSTVSQKLNGDIATYYKNNYLNKSNYLKFEGKPVVYILDATTLLAPGETTAQAANKLATFEQALGQDVFFVLASGSPDSAVVQGIKDLGFDAISPYYVAAGVSQTPARSNSITYTQFVNEGISINQNFIDLSKSIGIKYIPTTTTNFDERPRYYVDKFLTQRQHTTNHDTNEYKRFLEQVKAQTDANASVASIIKVNNKPVMGLGAYNEWMEDAQIEPGVSALNPNEPFKITNLVASTFNPAFTPLTVQGQQAPDLTAKPPVGKSSWSFGNANDLKLIYVSPGSTSIKPASNDYGSFNVENANGAGFLEISTNVNLANYSGIRLPFSSVCEGNVCTQSITVEWFTTDCANEDPSSCTDKVNPIKIGSKGMALADCTNKPNDPQWGNCDFIPTSGDSTWSGTLEKLRFIFFVTNKSPVTYSVAEIVLLPKNTTTPVPPVPPVEPGMCGLCGPLDRNGSGDFDILDIVAMSSSSTYGKTCDQVNYSGTAQCNACGSLDINNDGKISILDFSNIAVRNPSGEIIDSLFKKSCVQIGK